MSMGATNDNPSIFVHAVFSIISLKPFRVLIDIHSLCKTNAVFFNVDAFLCRILCYSHTLIVYCVSYCLSIGNLVSPDIHVLPLDYDPDTSFANIENRLQMLIMNARAAP
ncbi:MAG: hypothetical protein LBT01_00315 [Spirochaetaceae bacterium]|nr:hypothetical protein [Spirochaetaceae bacterium]